MPQDITKAFGPEHDKKLMASIAELGGQGFKEEDIVFEGNKLVLPEMFRGDLKKAIRFIQTKVAEEEETAEFSRTFKFRPWDGAYNAYQAFKKAFGMVHGKTTMSFFGPNPPRYIQIPISFNKTEEVPWGAFTLPILENTTIYFESGHDREYGDVFTINVSAPRKHRFIIEGLFKLVQTELEEHSIYRGKAVDGANNFLDLSGVNEARVVYSKQARAELEANVWAFMERADDYKKLGMPTKRSVLLHGTFGTGKSLTANVTALRAEKAGWTFIMARPGKDNFETVMQTAKLYQPAVVFMEDAEQFASNTGDDAQLSKILDIFDGISSKSIKMMVVMTTNHPDRLTEGMRRPGRIDQFISISNLDNDGVQKLIEITLNGSVAPDIDWEQVCEANAGYTPAFVKEGADRAIRYAVARGSNIKDIKITTEDLVYSANSLREQYVWMGNDVNNVKVTTMDTLIGNSIRRTVGELAAPAGRTRADVWNAEALQEVQSAG